MIYFKRPFLKVVKCVCFLNVGMWGLPFCYLFSSQIENEEGWWSVLCGLNNYLKTTAAADGHTYTQRDTHSLKNH